MSEQSKYGNTKVNSENLRNTTIVYTTKVIEIGDWTMDTTATINVAHGLSSTEWKTIKTIEVIVRSDDDTTYRHLQEPDGFFMSAAPSGYIDYFNNTNIVLSRRTGTVYDEQSDWNSTSYNRGFVTITYIED